MKLGMNVPSLTDGPQFLTVRAPDIATAPLLTSGSWAADMWSSNWIDLIPSNSVMASMNIPLLFGSEVGTAQGTTSSPQGPADTVGNGTSATLTISGSGSGFVFHYNSGAASSSTFAYNSSAATIQTALNSTAGVTGATVTASQTAGVFLVTFPAASAITASLLTTTGGTLVTYALMSLTDVAAGIWDAMFTKAFQTIQSVRPACVLRIGWEAYIGGGWAWSYAAVATQHCAAYQHLVTLARTVSASFTFDWCNAINWSQFGGYAWNPMTTSGMYPGNSYVDYITCDFYDLPAFGFGAAGWAASLSLIQAGLAFAQAHGKPYGFTEWGCGTAYGQPDDPAWIEATYNWARSVASSLCWIIYYQNEGGGNNTSTLQANPQSAAVYTQLFGAWARVLQGQETIRFVTAGSNRLRT